MTGRDLLSGDPKTSGGRDLFDPSVSYEPRPPRPGTELEGGPGARSDIGFGELGGAAAAGGITGAFTPEITKGIGRGAAAAGRGLQSVPFPPARGVGRFLEAGGRGMEAFGTRLGKAPILSSRVAPAALGAAGGALGEASGQATEFVGYPGLPAEAARIVGGVLVPTTISGVTRTGSRWGNMALDLAKRAFLQPETLTAKELTEAERRRVADLLDGLRGQAPEGEAAKRIYTEMQQLADDVQARASQKAKRLESAAPRLERGISQRQAVAESELASVGNVSATPTDLGERARRLVVNAQEDFENIRGTAYDAARTEVNEIATQKQQAGQFIEGTKAYQDLAKFLQEKTLAGRVGLEQPMATATERGVVSAYEAALNAIRNRRVAIGTSDQPEAVRLKKELEAKSLRVIERKDPNTNVTIYEREFPTAYEAIDDFRRRLGQSAKFGEPVTGYEALSASNAKDLYGKVSKVQEEFIGEPFKKMQTVYEQGSRALEPFAGKAGKKYAGIDFKDPTRFKTDPELLVTQAFGSRTGVDDLLRLSNNNVKEVETLARDYIASAISGKGAKQAEDIIARNKDMLSHPSLANLRNQIQAYVRNLKGIEAASERGRETISVLGKKVPAITAQAEKQASDIMGDKFPVARIKQLIMSGSPAEWKSVAQAVARTPQGRRDILLATREAIAEAAGKNPKNAVKKFKEDIAPALALPEIGIPKAAIDGLSRQLDEITKYASEPARLTMMQNVVNQFVRQYAVPRAVTGPMSLTGEQ